MIKVIPGEFRRDYPALIDKMHRLRREAFHERLRWQVSVINRWEVDGYDALDPLYVLSIDSSNDVVGGVRMLPTIGFTMLNDTFPELLPDGARIESPRIWESSRFAVRMTGDQRLDASTMSYVTAELGLALNEIGLAAGLSHIVTVYDQGMHRLLQRYGWAGEPFGAPQMIGGAIAYAVSYEVGPKWSVDVGKIAGAVGVQLEPFVVESIRARLTRSLVSSFVCDERRPELA
jgi:acyl homoserine lactone synthase